MSVHRSLVLVTVDCFRADHAGWLGYDRPTTPFLDSIAAESHVFSNAIVAGAPTYYSLPAILAARYPLSLGREVIGLAPGEATLATVLRDRGYATAAFVGGNPYLSANFGYGAGFEVFEDFAAESGEEDAHGGDDRERGSWRRSLNHGLRTLSYGVGQGSLYEDLYFEYCRRQETFPKSFDEMRRFPAADEVVDQACNWLARNKGRPFFLWLHLMDPHAPYYPRQAALVEMGDAQLDARRARYLNAYWNRCDLGAEQLKPMREEMVALYDAGIRHVDGQLQRLVGFLDASESGRDWVFAVTADHGEEFLEHGHRFHASAAWEELIRVPLLIRTPNKDARRTDAPFSLLKLPPALLNDLNVPYPGEWLDHSHPPGAPSPGDEREAAIFECIAGCTNPFRTEDRMGSRILCVREERYKMVVDFSQGREVLFDLEADPHELAPLPQLQAVEARRRMLQEAYEHLDRAGRRRDLDAYLSVCLRELRRGSLSPEILTLA